MPPKRALERVERRRDLLAPQLAGGLERDLAVAMTSTVGSLALPRHDQRVVAGAAQVTGDAAAGVRVGPRAGERRLADDLDAPRERRAHAGEQARDDREARLGRERVGARREVLPHQPRAEAVAAEELPVDRLVDLLDARGARGEIDDEHATVRAETSGRKQRVDSTMGNLRRDFGKLYRGGRPR